MCNFCDLKLFFLLQVLSHGETVYTALFIPVAALLPSSVAWGASLAESHFLLLDDVPFILFILKCSILPCKFIIVHLTVNSSMNFEPCVIFLGFCSPVLYWPLLQHQHTPLHPLSDGHLPGRIWTELLCHLSWKHLH